PRTQAAARDRLQIPRDLLARYFALAAADHWIFGRRIVVFSPQQEPHVNPNKMDDLSSLSMLELFRVEAENQAAVLTSGLLELERGPGAPEQLETLMRAAHSWKGAARIVNLPIAVQIAHAMED